MPEHVEELFLTKRLFHDFYSRPKIKRTGKMEDNAKPMHKKKEKKKENLCSVFPTKVACLDRLRLRVDA
jgi:hypothetical protein